ncbi:MAG: acyl-CoA dehydrogenase family protein [Pseudomonadota bacterium]
MTPDAFLKDVRDFASGPVAEGAAQWSLGTTPDPTLWRAAADLGLLRMTVPTAEGGLGFAFPTLVAACEALATVDFGFAMSLVNSHNVGRRLCLSAPEAVRARYLPRIMAADISACTALTEPGTGSDFAAITTLAHETGSGWEITGEKTWIVNGRDAGFAIVFAQTADTGEARGIGGFLVDLTQSGVQRHAIESAFSQTSMGTGGFTLDHAQAHLLLPPGQAFKSILTEINAARTYVASMANAMLAAALTEARAYGATRQSFGQTLDQYPSWHTPLECAARDLAQAQAYTATAVAQIASGAEAQLAAARAKVTAVVAAQRHLPEMLHAMGAEGLRPARCFTRHLAAAQIAGLTDGATNLLRERVSKLSAPRHDIPEG